MVSAAGLVLTALSPSTSLRSKRAFQVLASERVIVTALNYRSAAPRPAPASRPSIAGFTLELPNPANYAVRCLAVGIGRKCGQLIVAIAREAWFYHLRGTTDGPSRWLVGSTLDPWATSLENAQSPHVASIALPARPNPAQMEVVRAMGRDLRRRGALVIVTTASADPALPTLLSQACDCVLRGDGDLAHHSYPARTVVEPASGRLICYDLYDVCALWAGRIGAHGVLDPAADALHVELRRGLRRLRRPTL